MDERYEEAEQQGKVLLLTVDEKKGSLFALNLKKYPALLNITLFDKVALSAKKVFPAIITVFDGHPDESGSLEISVLNGKYKVEALVEKTQQHFLPDDIDVNAFPKEVLEAAVGRLHLSWVSDLGPNKIGYEPKILCCKDTL